MPECRTERGCPVGSELLEDDPLIQIGESIAADPYISQFINDFIRAKALYETNGIYEMQRDSFESLGLIDDPDFLLQLEGIWAEAKRERQRKANDGSKRTRY